MTSPVETYEKTFAGHDPLLAGHRFDGVGILPASVQLEMAALGVSRREPFTPLELSEVTFVRPLPVGEQASATVRLDVRPGVLLKLSGLVDGAQRTIFTGSGAPLPPPVRRPDPWPVSCPSPVEPSRLYDGWRRAGLDYSPDFQTVRALSLGDAAAEATLSSIADQPPWYTHPLLIDGVFQVVSCALQGLGPGHPVAPMIPIGVERVRLYAQLSRWCDVTVRVRRTRVASAYSVADALVLSPSGELLAELTGVRMRPLDRPGASSTPPTESPLVTQIRWTPTPRPDGSAAAGTWVVLHRGPDDPLGLRIAGQLRAQGAQVVEVCADVPAQPVMDSQQRRVMRYADEVAFERLWKEIDEPVAGVVHLWNTGSARPDVAELRLGVYGCLAAVKTLARRQRTAQFLVVTENSQPVAPGDTPVPARAALWGFVRTAAIEYPGLRPRLIDIDADSGAAVTAELGEGVPEVAYRKGERYEPTRGAARLTRAARPVIRSGGRYLILGGHGGIGLEVAARFAREGAGLVALVSRTGGAGADQRRLERIESYGCQVVSFSADVAATGAVATIIDQIRHEHGELHGVVHAAGTLRDGLIRGLTTADIDLVLRPKVDGVHELAGALAGAPLDFAVLFASVSGAFGNLGQAGYAAANAYLDGFAHARKAPWVSVDWGLWADVGMGTALAEQLRRRGVRPLSTAEALDALLLVLASDARQVIVAHPDAGDPVQAPAAAGTAAEPASATAQERVADALEQFLAERLGLATFDRAVPLTDYGMNSIMSVELSEELSRRWGVKLPATLFLEYGDFADLVRALTERHRATPPQPAPAVEPGPAKRAQVRSITGDEAPRRDTSRDIAITAVSGDVPGATDLAEFWSMLRAGRDAFTEVPATRWDVDAYFEPKGPDMTGTYCRLGAFLPDIDRLDPRFFGISLREAQEIDPQQKLLLEHAWSVIDDGGMVGRRDIGVFVGATYTHHRDAQGLATVGPHTALGAMNAVLANRISYTLDLTGPSQTVDTLCSSSLVALQQAVMQLRSGACGAAVVAACHVGLTPWYYRSLSQLGALSATRPRPFDANADGFLPGEGAIAVLLKRLDDAERDGDRIWGVIRGVAVNHGGRASALPVPRSEAQAAVIRAALADAEVAPESVTLVETHGTATKLGDPIEFAALNEVFGHGTRTNPCFLGSVKSNIGHLEPASGLAGLLKVLFCLHHREVPPLAGFGAANPELDLESGPFTIPTEPLPWRADGPLRAGVSAFGMAGTNAHVCVEEYVNPDVGDSVAAHEPTRRQVLVLSGHTPAALAQRVADVERMLVEEPAVPVGALCFSAAVGRAHLPHRLSIVGATTAELLSGLRRARALDDGPAGKVLHGPEVVIGDGSPAADPATELALAFVAGRAVDWEQLHRPSDRRRVSLPPYPFRAQRPTLPAPAGQDIDMRPLVKAHRVFGQETLPAAALLATAFQHARVLDTVRLVARGTGVAPLSTDLAGRAPGDSAVVRYDGRVVARLAVGRADDPPAPLSIDELRSRYSRKMEPAGLYAWFAAKGMELAAPLTPIAAVSFGSSGVLAQIGQAEQSPHVRSVAAIEAALQCMAVLTLADPEASAATYLPVSIGRAAVHGDLSRAAFAHLRFAGQEHDGTRLGDATLLDAAGAVLASLDAIGYRPVSRAADAPNSRSGPASPKAHAAILELVRRVLRDPEITWDTSLSASGLDSMLAAEIAGQIGERLHAKLSPIDVLEARDCRALAALVTGAAPPLSDEVAADRDDAGEDVDAGDVAVIGLACAMPGATSPRELWSMLAQGATAIGPPPTFRWNGHGHALGGFMDNVDEFDARFFELFPKQAEVLDPQARWLLRTTWEALESAGVAASSVPKNTGVFVGASYQHYKDYNIGPELDAPSGLGNHNAFLANRVSYFLDLRGPSMTIDTLCSSSLVALHTAVRSIRDGECDLALVSGVRVAMSPLHYTAMTNLRALSSSGASRAFDAAADGFIPGEGVVTIVIKPLTTAQQDGDRIRAIIKGTAINHGGRTSGLTVPNSTAQYEVITAALQDAQTDPQTIQLVEAHGTGTSLGDPIEIEGLTKAWRQSTNRRQYAAIGSLKTNLGHLEPAAGLAGLIKALLAIEHEQIPPTLHVTRPNDHIRFEDTPFYIADRPTPWPRTTTPRRAAISAFGMGGVNAHVIIEEPPTPPTRPPHTQDNFLLKVTGATPEAVRHLATAYANRFAESRDAWETADLCHTANIGRSELEFQTAVAGRDAAELAEALRAVAAGAIPVTRADAAASPPASARVEDVAEAVRRGYGQVDWASFSPPSARVADLPTYPFAQERYWHLRPGAAGENGAGPALARSVEDAVASGLPAAARIRWRRHALDLPAGPQPHRVRIVAPRPVIPAVAGALHEAGLSVAANAEPADAVVVVYEPDAGATSDLSGFWDDLQTLLASLPAHARVVWASHHWAAVGEDERARLLPQVAAGAAAVRAACAENRLACAVVDLDPADPIETRARHLASEVAALRPGTDTAAAYRAQSRFVPEPVPAIADEPVELSSDGYYLVTGGLGGVGRRLVEQLAACGARHIGILGRSRPHTAASLRELSRQAQIEYLSCDVTDDDALRAAAAAFAKRWGRLLGVVHCSGSANPFGSVRRREWTDAANVTAPKVAGSLNVVRLAKAEGAHFVVLVSSIAGAMPEAGRGLVDYALANAYQLALAERESDGPTVVTAHAWPAWAGVGMRADASFAATHAISAEQALRAFTSYLRAGGSVIFPGGALPAPPDPITTPVAASGEAPSTLVTLVRDAFVDVLGQDPGDRPVAELGLDSLTIADLAAALQRRYGRPVLPSIIMRANTIDDIAAALAPNSPTAAASAAVIPTPRPPTDANLGDLLRPLLAPDGQG